MTIIKNKQTGETLTGEVRNMASDKFFAIRIKGCRGENEMDDSEWEILPPPLPTGIGAVVKTESGNVWVRVCIGGKEPWTVVDGVSLRYSNEHVERCGTHTILSEGVTL